MKEFKTATGFVVYRTITVGELRQLLKDQPDERAVFIGIDGTFAYLDGECRIDRFGEINLLNEGGDVVIALNADF